MSSKNLEEDFQLLTEIGIPGTSYRMQFGLFNGKLASQLLKGQNSIDFYIYKDDDTEGGFPNKNLIVGWILRTLTTLGIDPSYVRTEIQSLIRESFKDFIVKAEEIESLEDLLSLKEAQLKNLKNSLSVTEKKISLSSLSSRLNEEKLHISNTIIKAEAEFDQIGKKLDSACEDLERLRQRYLGSVDDDSGFVTPYPPTPPNPPGVGGITKVIIGEKPDCSPYCKHCGVDLPEGQAICHVCGNKVE